MTRVRWRQAAGGVGGEVIAAAQVGFGFDDDAEVGRAPGVCRSGRGRLPPWGGRRTSGGVCGRRALYNVKREMRLFTGSGCAGEVVANLEELLPAFEATGGSGGVLWRTCTSRRSLSASGRKNELGELTRRWRESPARGDCRRDPALGLLSQCHSPRNFWCGIEGPDWPNWPPISIRHGGVGNRA
jgi:hypothetical protein